MTWHWKTEEWEGTVTYTALYEDDREVFDFGCVDSGCHCSGASPRAEDAKRIVDALNAADIRP